MEEWHSLQGADSSRGTSLENPNIGDRPQVATSRIPREGVGNVFWSERANDEARLQQMRPLDLPRQTSGSETALQGTAWRDTGLEEVHPPYEDLFAQAALDMGRQTSIAEYPREEGIRFLREQALGSGIGNSEGTDTALGQDIARRTEGRSTTGGQAESNQLDIPTSTGPGPTNLQDLSLEQIYEALGPTSNPLLQEMRRRLEMATSGSSKHSTSEVTAAEVNLLGVDVQSVHRAEEACLGSSSLVARPPHVDQPMPLGMIENSSRSIGQLRELGSNGGGKGLQSSSSLQAAASTQVSCVHPSQCHSLIPPQVHQTSSSQVRNLDFGATSYQNSLLPSNQQLPNPSRSQSVGLDMCAVSHQGRVLPQSWSLEREEIGLAQTSFPFSPPQFQAQAYNPYSTPNQVLGSVRPSGFSGPVSSPQWDLGQTSPSQGSARFLTHSPIPQTPPSFQGRQCQMQVVPGWPANVPPMPGAGTRRESLGLLEHPRSVTQDVPARRDNPILAPTVDLLDLDVPAVPATPVSWGHTGEVGNLQSNDLLGITLNPIGQVGKQSQPGGGYPAEASSPFMSAHGSSVEDEKGSQDPERWDQQARGNIPQPTFTPRGTRIPDGCPPSSEPCTPKNPTRSRGVAFTPGGTRVPTTSPPPTPPKLVCFGNASTVPLPQSPVGTHHAFNYQPPPPKAMVSPGTHIDNNIPTPIPRPSPCKSEEPSRLVLNLPALNVGDNASEMSVRTGDWIARITPLMKTLSNGASHWWAEVLRMAYGFYSEWLRSDPLSRLSIKAEAVAFAPDFGPLSRVEERASVLVLQALPEEMQSEAVSIRALSCTALVFLVLCRYQPGGGSERATILSFLTMPSTEGTPNLANCHSALKKWQKLHRRCCELSLQTPDPMLLVKALDHLAKPLANKSGSSFRISTFKHNQNIDVNPSESGVMQYAELILSEFEHNLISQPEKMQRVAALSAEGQPSLGSEPGKGEGKGKHGKSKEEPRAKTKSPPQNPNREPCKFFESPNGCRYGRVFQLSPTPSAS